MPLSFQKFSILPDLKLKGYSFVFMVEACTKECIILSYLLKLIFPLVFTYF